MQKIKDSFLPSKIPLNIPNSNQENIIYIRMGTVASKLRETTLKKVKISSLTPRLQSPFLNSTHLRMKFGRRIYSQMDTGSYCHAFNLFFSKREFKQKWFEVKLQFYGSWSRSQIQTISSLSLSSQNNLRNVVDQTQTKEF